ncbi:diphthine--ammonia ligase [Adhaeribacter aquaticus]|uniref:Dph6-related ATP pyrophosphatase n=1 Tax=Adhaeribacter aquaticus TaxID=299567 RepID=UPI0005515BCE|nr:diphthine--ammonia ligase [Adhaeribacter aquaticus]
MENAFFVWSGGKDSALALQRVLDQKQYKVKYLLTTVNETFQRVSMHGVRVSLLEEQAQAIGIPLVKIFIPEQATMEDYNQRMETALLKMKGENINNAIFGDIFLEDLRHYREKQVAAIGLNAVFPLWQESTTKLIQEFITLGFKAKLVCVSDSRLGKDFIGREIDDQFLIDLPATVDACGENGEYHSFVYEAPFFKEPVSIKTGEIIFRDYAAEGNDNPTNYDSKFWFLDLLSLSEKEITT